MLINMPLKTEQGELERLLAGIAAGDREALAALGDSLHGDEESVCKAISLVIYQLAKSLEETDRVRQQEEKRTAALCFSAAALMVILLI